MRDYAGLPILSDGYPSLGGKFLVITLSSAAISLDLHVLGTLPTLILSQDQTLRVDTKIINYQSAFYEKFDLALKIALNQKKSFEIDVHVSLLSC